MRIVNRDEMREIDRRTIEEYGIPGEVLMENAGIEFVNCFLEEPVEKRDRIAVLCGGGNNGGDGFVIARHLKRRGYSNTIVYLAVPEEKLAGDALANYRRLDYFDIEVRNISSSALFQGEKPLISCSRYVIDALLGLGFHGTPRGVAAEIIDFLESCDIPVLSVDLPSGVDADGQQKAKAVHARATYTMGMLKYGLIDFPGKAYCGKVRVLDIGFPRQLYRESDARVSFIDHELAGSLVPPREKDTHKGSYGHLGVIGGRNGFEGASLLSARAAARSGCGLVTIFFSAEQQILKPDEIILGRLPGPIESLTGITELEGLFARQNALVVGPGLGVSHGGLSLVQKILQLHKKVLIDADGLNSLAAKPEILDDKNAEVVITPHIGEMARIAGMTNSDVKKNKKQVALRISRQFRLTVVLKDAVTVVADKGDVFYNDGGVPALAKAGSGDVLSGVIGALMARGLSCRDAAVAGVYLHTECGRQAEASFTEDSVHAGDLIGYIPHAFRTLRGES